MLKKQKFLTNVLFIGILILTGCSINAPKPMQAASLSKVLAEQQNQYVSEKSSENNIPISLNQKQINFLPGTTDFTWEVNLSPDTPQTYIIQARTGQHLYIHHTGKMKIQVYDATNQSVAGPFSELGPWEVVIPYDGAYELAVSGTGKGVISVYIPYIENSWTPDLTSAPDPDHPERIGFTDGPTTTASTNLSQGRYEGVIFHAQSGQHLQVAVKGEATITLLTHEDQTVTPTSASLGKWSFQLPESGDYVVVILGEGVVQLTFTLTQ